MRDISKASPERLSKMMDLDLPRAAAWRPEELAAMFRHQMSAPIEFDLAGLDAGAAGGPAAGASLQGPPPRSFADLFFGPNPQVELLRLTKEFAKACRSHPDSPFPAEIATTLYFLSIVTALVRCRQRITQLDDEPLRKGVEWLLSQPWVDERARALFREALEILKPRAGETR